MSKPRVLVVEDDRLVARDLEKTLKDLGYEVVGVVPTGEEALLKAQETQPNLILMDIVLDGEMNGIEVAGIVRSKLQIPVIYLTAYPDKCFLDRTKETEPFGYLVKPFQENELRCTVEIALYKHAAEKAIRESEALRAKAEELAGLYSWEWDVRTGHLVWPPKSYRFFGLDQEEAEFNYDTFINSVHADDRDRVRSALRDSLEGVRPYDLEFRIVQPNGQERVFYSRGDVQRDAKGQPIRMQGMALDITEHKKALQELSRTAEDLAEAQRVAKIGNWVFDLIANKVTWSEELYRIFEIEKPDFAGHYESFASLIHPDDQPRVLQINALARNEGSPFDLKYRTITRDGRIKTLREVGYAHQDDDGKVIRLFGTAQDITDREEAEQQLREREEQNRFLASVIELSAQPFAVGYADGSLGFFNGAYCNLVGYTEEEMRQIDWNTDLTPPEYRDMESSKLDELVRTGQPVRYEKEYIRKDGTRVAVELLVHLGKDNGGEPEFYYSFLNDITERKRFEERLQEYERVVEGLEEMIVVVDRDYRYLIANAAFLKYRGMEREQVLGHLVPEVLDKEFFDKVIKEKVDECLQGKAVKYEMRYKYDKLGERDLLISYLPIKGPAGVDRVACVLQDITERKQAEEALRESERKFRETVAYLDEGYYSCTLDGILLEHNRAFNQILGLEISLDLNGESLPDFWQSPNDRADYVNELVRNGIIRNYPINAKRATGERLVVMANAHLVKDENKRPVRIQGTFTDITDLKEAEERLGASEEKYRSLFNSAEVGMFRTRLDGSEILDFNEKFLKIFNRTREEVKGNPSVIHWADPRERQEMIRRLNTDGRVTDYECKMLNKEGEERTCVTSLMLYPEQGILEGSITDITDRKKAEDALRESQEKYRMIFEHAPLGILHFDRNGVMLDFNDKFVEMIGAPREKLIGFNMPERQKDERMRQAVLDALDGKTSYYEGDYVSVTGGKLTPMRAFYSPVLSDNGKFLGAVGIFEDITERKQAEEALRKSEECYRTVADFTHDWEYWIGTDDKLLYVSPSCERITGYSAQEFLDDHGLMERIIHRDDLDNMVNHFHEARKVNQESSYSVDFRIIRRDGQVRWINHACRKVSGKGGQLLGRRASNRDITDRKRLELAQERLATAVEQAAEAIIITDTAGEIQYVNPAFEKITGYTREEAIGQNPRMLNSGEHDPTFYKDLWETITRGEVWTGRFTNKRKDGKLYQEDATISPVRHSEGEIVNFVAVKRDITEHLALSQQLLQAQKMEAIGTLAGGIAHDFNNLLQVTLGFSELLLAEKREDDPEYADLSKILQSARSGAELVQRLLTFSRKVEPKPIPLNLNRRILQVEKLLRRTIPKMIDIQMDLSDGLSDINADPTQMEQVLMNLAVNARDAMPDRGKFTVGTRNFTLDEEYCNIHHEAKPGEYVLLTVSDTGHGMDKATIDHIFEPFYTTKELGRGTGLGLAMVYGIVKQHGGFINCYSEVGHGTTFNVYFPAIESQVEAEVDKSGVMPAFGTETILLVDDEELVRDLGARILSKAGYNVLTATNGKEALDLFEKERTQISLVILDLIMPEMGGKECLKELRKMDPQLKVLIASGLSADPSTKESTEMGTRGFVSKPFRMKELLRQVRKVLDSD